MAADDPPDRYESAREQLSRLRERGEIHEEDADRIETALDAKDERKAAVLAPDSGTCALRSLSSYCRRLAMLARERKLSDLDADGVNLLIDDLRTGDTEVGPADGYADGTMSATTAALSAFYEVNDELGVEPSDITSISSGNAAIDVHTTLDREDIEALRAEITNTRDRALFELLTQTMQRIRAIQTLRVRDIDLENGVFTLNTEPGGLKGASGKRPLLNAEGPVRRWMQDHPTKDPDDYFITSLASASRGTPGEQLTQAHINRRLQALAERSGIEKPANAHAFRHYGVTVARRAHDMGWDEIAFMGGWAGPETPRQIYQHLSDEDYIEKVEIQFGVREPEDTDGTQEMTTTCQACDAVLSAGAKACPECGTVFAYDAKAAQESMQTDAEHGIIEVESDFEARIARKVLQGLREDPEQFLEAVPEE